MKCCKKILLLSLVILVVVIVAVVASINSILKKSIEVSASEILQVEVSVDKVALSLLEGTATISGLTIANPQGFQSDKAFYLGEVSVSLAPLSLLSDNIKINHINIIAPEIYYDIKPGQTNIGQIQKNIPKAINEDSNSTDKTAEVKQSSSKKISIDELLISGAKVNANIGNVQNTISIAEIKLNNIGDKNEPIVIDDAINKILSTVIQSAGQIDLNAITKEGLEDLKDNLLNKGIEGILGR